MHFNLALGHDWATELNWTELLYLSCMTIFQFFIKSINPSWFLYNNMGFNIQFVEVEVLWEFLMAKSQFLHTQISFLLLSVFQTTTDQVHFYPHLSSSLFWNFNYAWYLWKTISNGQVLFISVLIIYQSFFSLHMCLPGSTYFQSF